MMANSKERIKAAIPVRKDPTIQKDKKNAMDEDHDKLWLHAGASHEKFVG